MGTSRSGEGSLVSTMPARASFVVLPMGGDDGTSRVAAPDMGADPWRPDCTSFSTSTVVTSTGGKVG